MRWIGMALVVIGAAVLAVQGFLFAAGEGTPDAPQTPAANRAPSKSTPALLGGIALTTGLIVLAAGGRGRE